MRVCVRACEACVPCVCVCVCVCVCECVCGRVNSGRTAVQALVFSRLSFVRSSMARRSTLVARSQHWGRVSTGRKLKTSQLLARTGKYHVPG